MTNSEMLSECKRLAPTFQITEGVHDDGSKVITGSFSVRGKPFELTLILHDRITVEQGRANVLHGCIETLRRFH